MILRSIKYYQHSIKNNEVNIDLEIKQPLQIQIELYKFVQYYVPQIFPVAKKSNYEIISSSLSLMAIYGNTTYLRLISSIYLTISTLQTLGTSLSSLKSMRFFQIKQVQDKKSKNNSQSKIEIQDQ